MPPAGGGGVLTAGVGGATGFGGRGRGRRLRQRCRGRDRFHRRRLRHGLAGRPGVTGGGSIAWGFTGAAPDGVSGLASGRRRLSRLGLGTRHDAWLRRHLRQLARTGRNRDRQRLHARRLWLWRRGAGRRGGLGCAFRGQRLELSLAAQRTCRPPELVPPRAPPCPVRTSQASAAPRAAGAPLCPEPGSAPGPGPG